MVGQVPLPKGSLVELLRAGLERIRLEASAHGHPDTALPESFPPKEVVAEKKKAEAETLSFTRGQVVRHKPTGRKVTVLKVLSASSEYEVVDAKSGRKWTTARKTLKVL